jgi:TonB family protein
VARVSVVTGIDLLTEAAVSAVRRWSYQPARSGGVAVPRWLEVPVRFDLLR